MLVAASVQLSLLATALVDLAKRDPAQIRGSKRAWVPALFVNFIGPIAYLRFGRKR